MLHVHSTFQALSLRIPVFLYQQYIHTSTYKQKWLTHQFIFSFLSFFLLLKPPKEHFHTLPLKHSFYNFLTDMNAKHGCAPQ